MNKPKTIFSYLINIYSLIHDDWKSVPEIAATLGKPPQKIRAALARLVKLGMVGVKIDLTNSHLQRLYKVGESATVAPSSSKTKPFDPNSTAIAFKMMMDLLQNPITAAELKEESGMCQTAISQFLYAARKAKIIHICAWDTSSNCPARVYRAGRKNNAQRPSRNIKKPSSAQPKADLLRMRVNSVFNLPLAA